VRFPFGPFPDGWYAVGFSRDLPRGALVPLVFAGRSSVLFRGESGKVAMLGAHCAHMGANLGVGGRVHGDTVRCPMHGFAFDGAGRCVATGYGTRPPPACIAPSTPVIERNGIVLAHHHHSGAAPAWQPPEHDLTGFTPLRTHTFRGLATHPQETTENSVDLGHFSVVHGYRGVETVEPVRVDGPYLTTRYRMKRRGMLPGTRAVRLDLKIHVHGLGYSFVEADLASHGMRSLHFVLPTPTDGGRVDLHLATCVRALEGPLRHLPPRVLDASVGALVLKNYLDDVRQDLPIWENKAYVGRPALAEGDGPVGKYRSWSRQFYATPS
jgi:nitrite reductase/ring-hydroxylating ferredoxin subunit